MKRVEMVYLSQASCLVLMFFIPNQFNSSKININKIMTKSMMNFLEALMTGIEGKWNEKQKKIESLFKIWQKLT